MSKEQNSFQKIFSQKKYCFFSAKRYGIDALGAMAQGLFASLLIGTILSTLGEQLDGNYWLPSAVMQKPSPDLLWQ